MHAGSIIEQAATITLLSQPSHPYTRHLLAAIPRLDPARTAPAGQAQD
jgi:ABC-type oligopeptide transport system ATPase subunit